VTFKDNFSYFKPVIGQNLGIYYTFYQPNCFRLRSYIMSVLFRPMIQLQGRSSLQGHVLLVHQRSRGPLLIKRQNETI